MHTRDCTLAYARAHARPRCTRGAFSARALHTEGKDVRDVLLDDYARKDGLLGAFAITGTPPYPAASAWPPRRAGGNPYYGQLAGNFSHHTSSHTSHTIESLMWG